MLQRATHNKTGFRFSKNVFCPKITTALFFERIARRKTKKKIKIKWLVISPFAINVQKGQQLKNLKIKNQLFFVKTMTKNTVKN